MTYVCSQKWEDMQEVECGRFCTQCNKVVHDFSRMTIDEILQKKAEEPEICGSFFPHQVETDLIEVKFPVKWLAAVFSLGFLFSNNQAKAQTKTDTVMVQHPVQNAEDENFQLKSKKDADLPVCPVETEKDKRHNKRFRRGRWYISKRFPFIHYKRYFRGKY